MQTELADLQAGEVQNTQAINDMLVRVDEYVRREYLSVLSSAMPVPCDEDESEPGSNLRLMHLQSFTYDQAEDMDQRIRSIYGVLESTGSSAALLLDGRGERIHLYMGVFSRHPKACSSQYKAFLNSFCGVFPGCIYRNIKRQDTQQILKDLFEPDEEVAVAAVSAFSTEQPQEKRTGLAGLEALIDGMRGRPFTMLLLASALDRSTLVQMRQGYERLYTQISPLSKQDVTFSSSSTDTFGTNYSVSLSESLSVTTGINLGHTDTMGSNRSYMPKEELERQKMQAANQMLGAGISLLTAGTGTGHVLQSLFYSSAVSNVLNNLSILSEDTKEDQMVSRGEHEDHSDTIGAHRDVGINKGSNQTEGESVSRGMTAGRTIAYSMDNKSVEDLLNRLDEQIRELSTLENEGAFTTAAYFISADEETSVSAASLYRSVVTSGSGTRHYSPVYSWDSTEQTKPIIASLIRGIHPVFSFAQFPDNPLISAAQPIGLPDIPKYFCLPQKSLLGFHVTQHAAFARDILHRDVNGGEKEVCLEIGNIYHMGSVIADAPVALDANALAAHLFVAGATGVGKSNFCYQIIGELLEQDRHVMIIEPAKGEYAKVFGGRQIVLENGTTIPEFHVYGTNLFNAPPLRINPFAFPQGVTSAEHIERLVSIFCAAWPMYSAMPAIIKEALEEIYRKRGFDEIWGLMPEDSRFPNFQDLLETLPEIIRRSEYSQEVQGNYIGALVTRVISLTNGIYNVLFTEDEIGDEALFDQNVIIDISRIGSDETKSLIMGFLITRLSEYRGCSGRMNSELRHVTVLEEAHHLLGHNTQSVMADGGNMKGASVEMISNAIREMRTYGEGFLIADQSAT